MSAKEIKAATSAPISVRQVERIISGSDHLKYKKMLHTPVLTQVHKVKRIKFAWHFLSNPSLWNTVIYSDKKKFNLDSPDSAHFYWHNLRKDKQMFATCQQGGKSVMVWAAFCAKGKSNLCYKTGKLNSLVYLQILHDYLLKFKSDHFGAAGTFQQDNAPIHSSRVTKAWFQVQRINVLEWPPNSPDLNPMENLWGIMAQEVYKNGKRQFNGLQELQEAN